MVMTPEGDQVCFNQSLLIGRGWFHVGFAGLPVPDWCRRYHCFPNNIEQWYHPCANQLVQMVSERFQPVQYPEFLCDPWHIWLVPVFPILQRPPLKREVTGDSIVEVSEGHAEAHCMVKSH